jgi:hypothetical protein
LRDRRERARRRTERKPALGFTEVFEVTDAMQRSWQFRAMFGLPLRRE